MDSTPTTDAICLLVINLNRTLYETYMRKVNDIDIDYFDISHDCEQLPESLHPSLKSNTVDEMRNYVRSLLEAHGLREQIKALHPTPEEMDEARRRIYSNGIIPALDHGNTDVTDRDLERLYRNAQRRNLWERLFQTNKEDVHKFFLKLQEKTYEECKEVYYQVIDEYLKEI